MSLRESRDDGVLWLTMDRPESYNAIDARLRDELLEALVRAEATGARCIVLNGIGPGFCSGADLKAGAADLRGVEVGATMRRSTSLLAEQLIACPIPVIASVHGVCAGIGLTLALAADYCIAATDARFLVAFTRRSLVPDGAVTYLLPRVIGLGRARRLLLFGSQVTAPEALDMGMIGEVVDPAELAETTELRARELADLPTQALSMTKSLLARSFDVDLGTSLMQERAAQSLLSTTHDYAEGVAAFREKRPPRFQGR